MRSPRPTGSISSSRSVRSTRDRTPGTSGRGVTYYNFTSDQFTGFHAIVVPGTIRDSLYVLDGLLEHETSLEASEIVTDTAAYQRPHLRVVPPARVSVQPAPRRLGEHTVLEDGPASPATECLTVLHGAGSASDSFGATGTTSCGLPVPLLRAP